MDDGHLLDAGRLRGPGGRDRQADLDRRVGGGARGFVPGKPISIGGSIFRSESTGAGVVMVIERAYERLGLKLEGARCVVQGFGKVGAVAAVELAERGAHVIAVSDVGGGIYGEHGRA